MNTREEDQAIINEALALMDATDNGWVYQRENAGAWAILIMLCGLLLVAVCAIIVLA